MGALFIWVEYTISRIPWHCRSFSPRLNGIKQEFCMNTQPISSEVIHPYVERRPGVQGGRPIIKNRRFPVSSIVQNYRRGLSVEEILHEFPQLSPAEVHDALSYYYDHQAEIDREIAELTELSQTMQRYPSTIRPSYDGSD
jgi:uncharacterized protein (DUF433 family)